MPAPATNNHNPSRDLPPAIGPLSEVLEKKGYENWETRDINELNPLLKEEEEIAVGYVHNNDLQIGRIQFHRENAQNMIMHNGQDAYEYWMDCGIYLNDQFQRLVYLDNAPDEIIPVELVVVYPIEAIREILRQREAFQREKARLLRQLELRATLLAAVRYQVVCSTALFISLFPEEGMTEEAYINRVRNFMAAFAAAGRHVNAAQERYDQFEDAA